MSRARAGLAAGLAALLLSACAVLTVDVDVYKGPLANERQVQMQQMAVMATAAKPLLVQLRNQVESPRNPDEVRLREGYDDGYVDSRLFSSPYARQVNAILGLYDDRVPRVDLPPPIEEKHPALAEQYDGLRLAVDEYARAQRTLDDIDGPLREWRKLKPSVSPAGADLATAYDAFFDPQREGMRYKDKIFEALAKSDPAVSADPVVGGVLLSLDLEKRRDGKDPALEVGRFGDNLLYYELADDAFLATQARLLFPGGTAAAADNRRTFVDLVGDIARAFADARGAEADVLERTLFLILEIQGSSALSVWQRVKSREVAAKMAAQLIQPQHLRLALADPDASREAHELFRELTQKLDSDGVRFDKITSLRGRATKTVSLAVAQILAEQPSRARELIELHRNFRTLDVETTTFCPPGNTVRPLLCEKFSRRIARKYGISRGPYDVPRKDVARLLSNLDLDEPLDHGRLDEGLETMIENYLKEAQGSVSDGCVDRNNCAESRLLEGMVYFSEKILFLVNNDVLLRQKRQKEIGWIPWSQQVIRETLWRGKDESVTAYTRLLQAVGNSIQVLANELQHKRDHERRIDQVGEDAERVAITLAGERSPGAFIDEILAAIQSPDHQLVERLPSVRQQRSAEEQKSVALANAESALVDKQTILALALAKKKENEARLTSWNLVTGEDVKKAFGASEKLSADDVVKKLTEALGQTRLKGEWDALEAELKRELAHPAGAEFTADNLNSRIANLRQSLQAQIDAMTQLITEANAAVAKSKADLEGVKGTTPSDSRGAAVAEAVKAVREVRASVEARLPAHCSRQAVVVALRHALVAKDKDTHAILELIPLPPPPPPTEMPGENAIDVNDALLAQLEHERIQAVAALGKSSPKAQYLSEAIDLAYQRRSGRIDLRSGSSFLRSSYKTTALQDDASLGGKNLLAEHALKQLPFASSFMRRGVDHETLQEIDKQFWQSVNHIRVAGAGDTNYVVAKDDVGNWYVKNMSSDPEEIIEGAQSLALFAAGGGMGADLLSMRPNPQGTPGAAPTPLVDTQVGKFRDEYTTKTSADRAQLKGDMGTLKGRAVDAMSPDPNATELKASIDEALSLAATKSINTEIFTEAADATTLRKEIMQGLRQIPSFYRQAVVEIASKITLTDEEVKLAAAKAAVTKAETDLAAAEADVTAATAESAAALKALEGLTDASAGATQLQERSEAATAKLKAAEAAQETKKTELETAKTKLTEAEKELSSKKDALAYARRTLAETLGKELKQWVERRSSTATHYRTAMEIIGDLGGSAETP